MTSQGSQAVTVTAIGMVTSLGLDVVTSCAAARAGLNRTSVLKVLDFQGDETFGCETPDGVPAFIGSTVRGIADAFSGPARMLLLGNAALADLLRQRPLSDQEHARTGFVLNLSDHFILDVCAQARGASALPSVEWRTRTARLHIRLAKSHALSPIPEHMVLLHAGQAGLASAIQHATTLMAKNSVDRCIVGAIDSRAEAGFLKAAGQLRLLRTNDNPVGLIPGEAAAFLMLERSGDSIRDHVTPVATVAAVTIGKDPTDLLSRDHTPQGIVLADMMRAMLGSSPQVGFVVGDLNGTVQRAVEWGSALVRLRGEPRMADLPSWFPALSFGDTGAASGAISLCVAARAFARGYAPGKAALVSLSSENGDKAAMVIQTPAS